MIAPDSGPVKKRRKPVNLTIKCPVCGGPAPDHVHFGGRALVYILYVQEVVTQPKNLNQTISQIEFI